MNEETKLLNRLEGFEPKALEVSYPAALAPRIASDETVAWAVSVPDLPGCIAEGATQEEVMTNAVEAVETWLARQRAGGSTTQPSPTLMDTWARSADYAGWTWFFVGTTRLTEADRDRVEAVLDAPPETPELSVLRDDERVVTLPEPSASNATSPETPARP